MASAQEIITAIDQAILEVVASGGATSLTILGTEKTWNLDQLRRLRVHYASLATSEQGSARNYVRF